MIILLHGTGDDDSKAENWMPWVAKIMEKHGEKALTIPGVASEQYRQVGANALAFLTKVGNANQGRAANHGHGVAAHIAALNDAGDGEYRTVSRVAPGQERTVLDGLIRNQQGEVERSAHGIKFRAAVAALCALYYYRRTPNNQLRPIRIIGHSRGGATAVALHNILTYYGIPCTHTLTLDPCHGLGKVNKGAMIGSIVPLVGTAIGALIGAAVGEKDYYSQIWEGQIHNIPCKKEVGNLKVTYTYRPPITVGAGGHAVVANHDPKLPHIKHGHMGKLVGLAEDEKAAKRRSMTVNQQILVDRAFPTTFAHLTDFFRRFVPQDADYADRTVITNAVVMVLTN